MALLAEELLQVLTKHPYELLLRWIHTEHKYIKSEVTALQDKYTSKYTIDTTRCVNKHGRTVTNGLFDIFGKFSKKNAVDTRKAMIEWIKSNMPEVKQFTSIAFKRAFMTVEDWLVTMTLNSVPGDELAIYCLSKMYLRHIVVYTKKYYWTTVAHDWADTEEIVGRKCELELIYMGPGRFGEFIPVITPGPPNPPPAGIRTSNRTKNRINYASMNTGTEENKKERKTPPKKRKRKSPLPKKEPSAKRIKSQKMLTRQGLTELSSPTHRAKLVGTAIITSPSGSENTQPEQGQEINTEPTVKTEPKIKSEDDLLRLPPNIPRKVVDLKDPNVPLIIRHTDGSICHSKKSYASFNKNPPPRPDELPDLPELNETENSNETGSFTTTSLDCAQKSKESELRELLDIANTNSVPGDVNTENPPAPASVCTTEPPTTDQIANQRQEITDNENPQNSEATSINTDLETPDTTNGKQIDVTDANENIEKTPTPTPTNDDLRDLQDAGLSLSVAKPMEKVYNEWITTFSDDSLFDEMTEKMRNEDPAKSPEHRAAEGLLLLRNQESNETLMPVDAPKLPDLVREMDAENQTYPTSINSRNNKQDNSTETDNTQTNHAIDTTEPNGIRHEGKDKDIQKATKADSSKSPTKGVFQMRTIGLRKHKSPTHRVAKRIGCSMCSEKFANRNELKTHHHQDHNILTCTTCGKSFSTKKSLAKHAYKHSELPWKCKKCGEGYAFPSELKAHLVKHETEPMFKCNLIGCNKEYMRQSELNAHLKTHDGTIHKCPEKGCVYEAIDIRYLKNHMRVHSDELPCPCKECNQAFKHFMQRKRHYANRALLSLKINH